MSKDDYGPMMGINAFFNAPDVPADEVAGWYVRGENARGDYEEFVVLGNDTRSWPNHFQDALFGKVDGWIGWHRIPLRAGDPLLVGAK